MGIEDIRREYSQGGLRRKDLNSDPIVQFNLWLQQAVDAKLTDPTAMTVATVDERGMPFQRIVLLKNVDSEGFVFYTNLGSRKAQHIEHNSKVSLHFPWHPLERQVHITGVAEKLTAIENMKYFTSRPKESQLAAIASKQSSRISTRGVLEGKFLELKQKFAKGEIPVPSFWGGYRIRPESIEFWQGGEHRLHDRFLFSKDGQGHWDAERLAP
ncbi:pyridoxamine 5'-phosphate oxidase [Vibrio mediterranei]|jgi:pyridoxamine 5'-phosphate oxidase|uniref:Pyridoxine/pyridoxamine 5'-phosphate oxidase n=1 Tax=Vibrio mediterranei TaxID=689 RepID=A0ABX5D760_9VIBR|nr:pyridoxamine 5'-phosphate oxidase [Vibrio mediterranei]MCG9666196.1 pyridoxamine 5'-phosphate oxidase [Vibrio mediterranei]PCD86201.1 pyridoxamine 5'-phosphate oxidase [Vibrio mediterranei]PRQ65310.1 pyridoxamine 5'-phosphate oxidase [Vibrio mediterranei]PTC06307.1 pyridoxamine 5'-phosphate oxidase [Vibrio mediterranei]